MGVVDAYVHTLSRSWIKYVIVCFWTACLIWGMITGLRFPTLADNSIPATEGTRAYDAQELFSQYFPDLVNFEPWTLLIYSQNGSFFQSNHSLSQAKTYFDLMGQSCSEWIASNYPSPLHSPPLIAKSETYFTYVGTDLDAIASGFVSPDGKTMIMALTIDTVVEQTTRYDLYHHIRDIQAEFARKAFGDDFGTFIQYGTTGEDPLADDANAVIISDLERADMITMPLAFAVLAYMIRSWRLLLISLFNLGVVIVTSFGVMTIIVKNSTLPNQSITPQFMEVMGLAMSIDYSLFMFTRFQVELQKRISESTNLDEPSKQHWFRKAMFHSRLSADEFDETVRDMLRYSGHVIFMSGACLVVSFGGFFLLDCTFLETIALGNIITISLCIVISLTSSPAWLLIFPGFFSAQDDPRKLFQACLAHLPCLRRRPNLTPTTDPEQSGQYGRNSEATHLSHTAPSYASTESYANHSSTSMRSRLVPSSNSAPESFAADMIPVEDRPAMHKSYWYRMTRAITVAPFNFIMIILMYLGAGFLAYQVLEIKLTTDFTVGIPHDSPAYTALVLLGDGFGAGHTQNFYLLQSPLQSSNSSIAPAPLVKTELFFAAAVYAINELINGTVLSQEDFITLTWNGTGNMDWEQASTLLQQSPPYAFEWNTLVDSSNKTMLHQIIVPFDPNTNQVKSFIEDVYDVLDAVNEIYTPQLIKFDLTGFKVNEHDTITHAVERFPKMLIFTVIVIFVLMAFFLRSAFVPVRLLLTLGVPVAATFGLCVSVYQHGILNWLHIGPLRETPEGFYWDIPVISFSIIVGLALDYDVFLICRVVEYRKSGYTGRASVIRAVMDTASIITAAGIIMALAFSSMLLMSAQAVKQVGWLLTSSVLLDTFIVRTMLVPAVMSIADGVSWWPRKMPKPSWDEFGDKAL